MDAFTDILPKVFTGFKLLESEDVYNPQIHTAKLEYYIKIKLQNLQVIFKF